MNVVYLERSNVAIKKRGAYWESRPMSNVVHIIIQRLLSNVPLLPSIKNLCQIDEKLHDQVEYWKNFLSVYKRQTSQYNMLADAIKHEIIKYSTDIQRQRLRPFLDVPVQKCINIPPTLSLTSLILNEHVSDTHDDYDGNDDHPDSEYSWSSQ